jgi:hypothetical protein
LPVLLPFSEKFSAKNVVFFSAPTVLKMALICVLTVELADNLLEV